MNISIPKVAVSIPTCPLSGKVFSLPGVDAHQISRHLPTVPPLPRIFLRCELYH